MAVIGTPTITTRVEDGKRYTTTVVVQDATTAPGDEVSIPCPEFCTITLHEEALEGVGAAADTRPVIGVVPGFVVNQDGFLTQALAAATFHKIAEDKRATARPDAPETFGRLYYRSTPDVGLSGSQTITTRITVVWGHR